MLQFLIDLIPVLLFFIAFKFYDIYIATMVGIISTGIQVLITFFWKKKFDRQQLLTLGVFIIFGGMTLYFHDPLFVKWKPTIIFWIMALAFFGSYFIGDKTLAQRMLEKGLDGAVISKKVWQYINALWVGFLALIGGVNIFVAYHFSTNAWVNFKLYGISGLLLLFCIIQAIVLSRYMVEKK
ncbi:MAG: septation protein A [Gammaproteobacteria bacterium]|nr:septation protein A [Gammaproteobacteria bacterium]